ncbi:iron chaperone [Kitasatospora sp. NPDC059648]|uniref:iron chaperone n=1 Tax=Kitasatospora sp. NPDC059648 TaxID=3346894 RepID=UPI003697657B
MQRTESPAEEYTGFTAEERAAMKEHAQEQKRAVAGRGSRAEKEAAAEREVLAKIAEMPEADRVLAEGIHALVKAVAPDLTAKLWYGMPAYARDGRIICHFQSAQKFKSRYATLGFSDQAALDDGDVWPVAYAVKHLTPAEEEHIGALVRRAVG